MPRTLLTFGPFQLDPGQRSLLRDGKPVRLGSRALEILIVLTGQPGELISRQLLMERVWPSTFVDEANLRVHIAALRRVLGDGSAGERFIATVSGRGYSFVAAVDSMQSATAESAMGADAPQETHNLPAPLTRTIGRDNVVRQIATRLHRRRFVTVTGPGGIGKTTVVVTAAEMLIGAYRDGVCFVDFGPLAEPELVPTATASALGVSSPAGDPIANVLAHLDNKSMLIVLDNCEHVIELAALLAERILRNAPGTHLLATSREPFRAQGELLVHLAGLAVSPSGAKLSATEALAFPAIELFVDRATAVLEAFALTDANVGAVSEICRRLDGIPLAIELAAARVGHFEIAAIVEHLGDRFSLLTIGRRTALPRHRTLRAAIDWSHASLSTAEQTVLRRLAPFVGWFSIEAAIAIVSDALIPAAEIRSLLGSLVDKSLLTADIGGTEIRYRLLETTRAYAAEKLRPTSDAVMVARRYATYFLNVMRRAETRWKLRPTADWLACYAWILDDVRAALDWAFSGSSDLEIGLQLTVASAPLWFQLSLMAEYGGRARLALDRLALMPTADAVTEMRLLVVLGHAIWYGTNDLVEMASVFSRALALAEQAGDVAARLEALWGAWASLRGRGDFRGALEVAKQYEALAKTAGDQDFIILGDRMLGLTYHCLGDQPRADGYVKRVLLQARLADHPTAADWQVDSEVAMASVLARIQWLQGLPDQARRTAQEAIDAACRTDHRFSVCYALYMAGCPLALWTGDLGEAQRRVDLLADRAGGNPSVHRIAHCYRRVLALRQGGERERLLASYIEARVELSAVPALVAMASSEMAIVSLLSVDLDDSLWNAAEMLRVNAELLLWHGLPETSVNAEEKLLKSLRIARAHSALSWELRSAMSLARLWCRSGRPADARDLVTRIRDRFTEGSDTEDLVAADQLISSWA